MNKNDDDYTEFDEVNDLLILPKSSKGRVPLFHLYENNKLWFATRSAQLHKLEKKEWWPKITDIKVTWHDSVGAAEDAKIEALGKA